MNSKAIIYRTLKTMTRPPSCSAAALVALAALTTLCALPAVAGGLGEIDVTDYGAVADGRTDNTAIFQRALNDAIPGGAVVRVPAGQYYFAGTLDVPAQVVLKGVNAGERTYSQYANSGGNGGVDGRDVTPSTGTVFLVTAGAGNANGTPFLTLHANSAVKNATFLYPNQPDPMAIPTSPNWTPVLYPYTISMTGTNGSVDNVNGVNPYQFIEAADPGGHSIRENIRHVNGTPLMTGILIDADGDNSGNCADSVADVHFIPGWGAGTVLNWVAAHATAYYINRADDITLRGCFAFFYNCGFHFGVSYFGAASGTITNCGTDTCDTGVQIDNVDSDFGGLVFEGGAYSATGNGFAVNLNSLNSGDVTFNGSRFWGPQGGLVMNASQTGSVTSFIGCNFLDWSWGSSGLNPAATCIYGGNGANQSAASGKTRVAHCQFKRDQYQYTYTPGEAGFLFEGNNVVNGIHAQIIGAPQPSATGPNYIQVNNF